MNLLDFQSILDASTPDGRWNLLQDFLKKNPEWRSKVNRWLTLDPDTTVIQLQADLAERMKIPIVVFSGMISTEMRQKAKAVIESLQTLYRERQANNQTEKEIEDVRVRRTIEKRSGKNPRGKTARTKRTDQT